MSLRRRATALLGLSVALAGVQTIGLPAAQAAPVVEVQILATNDFHGRIANDPASAAAGAGALAGAVKQLRTANPNTVFAAAGDLIGATTFDSFIANDKPTIDSLNEAGLEVSAVGNHEFDQGYADLVDRVMQPESGSNPDGGAAWEYLGANVKFKAGGDALEGSWMKTMGGVDVGFVGAVTEDLPQLVTPAGIADIEVTDVVEATNEAADELTMMGADLVVLLVHEGSGSTDCAALAADTTSNFGGIVSGVNQNVDAIVSGHTHLEYNCSLPVPDWAADADRIVKERPVVSAGQYGTNLNRLVFRVDQPTGQVVAKTQSVVKLKAGTGGASFTYPADAPTQTIVDAAVAAANVLGAEELGQIAAPLARAKFANGTTENRGGESTLNNLTAEIQRYATRGAESGAAQIAFMNPGGLRADLLGNVVGTTRTVTYRQAANVQPFANTLVNMDLTGAQLKATLEQQWQPAAAQRPFLKLGASKGFAYTYDASRPQGQRILEMRLNDVVISPATSYSVTVNSFLASGGDNFAALNGGAGKQDTGRSDLQAVVDYLEEFAEATPLPVDYRQQAVGVKFPAGAPASYAPGGAVAFGLTSLSMTDPVDLKDTAVSVSLGGARLGTFPVTTTPLAPGDANSNDETGTAAVSVVLPAGVATGQATLTVTGVQTGTSVPVRVQVGASPTTVKAKVKPNRVVVDRTKPRIRITVKSAEGVVATGKVTVKVRGRDPKTVKLEDGKAKVTYGTFKKLGKKKAKIAYAGDAAHGSSTTKVTFTVKGR